MGQSLARDFRIEALHLRRISSTAITQDIQAAATSAELKQRGSGIAYILRRLKLGPDPHGSECR